MIILFSIL